MDAKRRNCGRQKSATHDLESLLRLVKKTLISDFRKDCNLPEGAELDHPSYCDHQNWPAPLYKRAQQIKALDKRILWSSDKDVQDLETESLSDFVESQKTFGVPDPLPAYCSFIIPRILEVSREILRDKPDYNEVFAGCSFARHASFLNPKRKSYLDCKVQKLTGTKDQIELFKACLSTDLHLNRALRKRLLSRLVPTDTIKVVAVPKSFKASRIVAPDTVCGGFLSAGVGAAVRSRLESCTHISLARAKENHFALALKGSRDGKISTLDMSKASDSFTFAHLDMFLPREWANLVKVLGVKQVVVGDKIVPLTSAMLMGQGITFPMQTVLFYAIAEAVRRCLKAPGRVYVYGDDVIVPTVMAKQTILVLEGFGFTLNREKSFFDYPELFLVKSHTRGFFRESCGGDFMNGHFVRPFMPEYNFQSSKRYVNKAEYLSNIHKIYNGLCGSFDPLEIPITCGLLLNVVSSLREEIFIVPTNLPVYSGFYYIPPDLLVGRCVASPKWNAAVQSYVYSAVCVKVHKRPDIQTNERIYYWNALRLMTARPVSKDPYSPDTGNRESDKDKDTDYRIARRLGV